MSSLPSGLHELQLKFLLLTLWESFFFLKKKKEKGKIDPALLNLHRRKCETSVAEVNSLLQPMPLPTPSPPCPQENNAVNGAAAQKTRKEEKSRLLPSSISPASVAAGTLELLGAVAALLHLFPPLVKGALSGPGAQGAGQGSPGFSGKMPGNTESLSLCTFGLFSFCLHDTVFLGELTATLQ